MKRFAFLLGMMLSVASLVAQDFYTIQVRSMSKDTPLTQNEIETGMWQHKVGGLTKCFMGRFDTYDQAKKALLPLRATEYSDAFVVSSDKIFGTKLPQASSKATPAPKPVVKEEVTTTSTKPAKPVVSSSADQVYTIQIAAYRYPLYTKEFKLEDPVMEFYCSDNIYRYTVGKHTNEADARALLQKIKNSGYPDAFLIDYKKYEVYRIE